MDPSPIEDYRPRPVDTFAIELAPELEQLVELLARNAHAVWARARIAAGWSYGPARDDGRKEHPGLVPYERLPDSEKQYDREVAVGTLKAVLALGYEVSTRTARPGSPGSESRPSAPDPTSPNAWVQHSSSLDIRTLSIGWRGHSEEHWAGHPELYRSLGERLLERGAPLLAHDVVSEGMKYWPKDVRLGQLLGLALARSGAVRRAAAVLSRLHDDGREDEETLGLLARTHKDLASETVDPAERGRQLRLAHQLYLRAYRLGGGSYAGVNAATTALLLGRQSMAEALAGEVRRQTRAELGQRKRSDADCYYQLATLGEAALILGDGQDAERWYARAVAVGRERFGDLSSTRRNARLILDARGSAREWVDRLVPVPRVVVFAGCMVDRPGRPVPRFPPAAEAAVAEAINQRLEVLNAGIGFSSAASGGDILFLEAMARRQGETTVVLPYDRDQFIADSVAFLPGGEWATRFDRALDRAAEVVIATEQPFAAGGVLHQYADLLLLGLASLESRGLDTDLVPLALWDGEADDGPRGTAGITGRWQASGRGVDVIDLREIVRQWELSAPAAAPAKPAGTDVADVESTDAVTGQRGAEGGLDEPDTHVMGILFADVVHFSRMSDREIPLFVRHFLGAIDGLIHSSSHAPVVRNTWGDGLYLVFSTVRDTGLFALELCDLMLTTDWSAKGLPQGLDVRVALHAGPLFACIDPVTRQPADPSTVH